MAVAQQVGDPPGGGEPARPWKLQSLVGDLDWLWLSGEVRGRWEGIDGQFRSATRLDGSDHLAFTRAIVRADFDFDPVDFTVEVMDARHYGGSTGSSLNTTHVNTLDFLQLYAEFDFGTAEPSSGGGVHRLRVGRQTHDLGSRRLVARNRFRNTINSFAGASWLWDAADGESSARVFWMLPTRRRPNDLPSIVDNEIDLDDQDLDIQFFGGYYDQKLDENTVVEAYLYGLHEDETGTRRRQIFTPGARVRRTPMTEAVDFEWEAAYQFGDSRLTSTGADLDHEAWFQHISVGYTFDAKWKPRVRAAFDYASGDRDPTDGDNNRFETLFGARRFEYGPTGIYGAIARGNLASPDLRVELRPAKNQQWMIAWRGLWLASEQDAWTTAGVANPTGLSGRHAGQQIETRYRWDMCQNTLRLEGGLAYLFHGGFQDTATGAQNTDTGYAYVQLRWKF